MVLYPLGPYIKYDRNLGGRGGWWIAVSISNSDVILFSNNDIILQSEGGRGSKKAKKLRTYLKNLKNIPLGYLL